MKQRPKFVVGELVAVRPVDLEGGSDCTEVVDITWCEEDDNNIRYTGWGYRTAHVDPAISGFYKEQSLRKLPPEEGSSWEDCVWSPIKETA